MPFQDHQTNHLPIEVGLIVPSTRDGDNITETAFKNRVRTARKKMSSMWGGDTTVDSQGGWINEGGELVSETTAVVRSYTTPQEWNSKKSNFRDFVKKKRNSWKQTQLTYIYDGDFFLYPKKPWAADASPGR